MQLSVSSDKISQYCALVDAVNTVDTAYLNGMGLEPFPLCDEINLWAYWQGGRSHLNAELLLVGQDWGALSYGGETIAKALQGDSYNRDTFCYMTDNYNPTNLNLCELFSQIGERYDLRHDCNAYEDLFFTNFVPWYRTGNTISGEFRKEWAEASTPFFKKLVSIIQPKVILCLGKSVFDAVLRTGAPSQLPESKYYNKIIEEGSVEVIFSGVKTQVFPLAHCGTYGTMNRNARKGIPKERMLDLQKQDWRRVSEQLRRETT